jgi:hypothetical protein
VAEPLSEGESDGTLGAVEEEDDVQEEIAADANMAMAP